MYILPFSAAKKRTEDSTAEEKQQDQQQQPKTKKKKKEKEKTVMDEEKEAAIAAEVKAARERALVPLEIRMKQFKDMLLERGVSIKDSDIWMRLIDLKENKSVHIMFKKYTIEIRKLIIKNIVTALNETLESSNHWENKWKSTTS